MNARDPRNFAIGVLSTTASILFVGLLLLQNQSQTASAAGMTTSGGNYILTVGRLNQTDEELLYLIDSGSDKLIAYRFDATRRSIEVFQGVDLGEIRRAATPAGSDPPATAQPAAPPKRSRQP